MQFIRTYELIFFQMKENSALKISQSPLSNAIGYAAFAKHVAMISSPPWELEVQFVNPSSFDSERAEVFAFLKGFQSTNNYNKPFLIEIFILTSYVHSHGLSWFGETQKWSIFLAPLSLRIYVQCAEPKCSISSKRSPCYKSLYKPLLE